MELSAFLFGTAAKDHRICSKLISHLRYKYTSVDRVDEGDKFRQDFVEKMIWFGRTENSSK